MTNKEELKKQYEEFASNPTIYDVWTAYTTDAVSDWWLSKLEQIRKEDVERVVEIVTDLKRSGAELITTPLGFDAWKRDNYFHNLALDEILSIIKQAHGTN